jgi:hypothetical protein
MKGRGASAQYTWHARTIHVFADQWPNPDLSDYAAAMTPAYHLVLAAAVSAGLDSDAPPQIELRLLSSGFTIVLLGVLTCWCARRTDALTAFCMTVPMAVSPYVLYGGAWLLPDNAGWLGVLVVLLIALRNRPSVAGILAGGAALVLVVVTRQIHIWTAAVLWVSAWVTAAPMARGAPGWLPPFDEIARRARSTALMFVATLPAFLVLLGFYRHWGGNLTPPTFVVLHNSGLNPAAPAFVLAIFAIVSFFYAPILLAPFIDLCRRAKGLVALVCLIGLVIAFVPPTSFSQEAGRWSGLWNVARVLPAPGGRSILIAPLSVAGAFAALAWARALPSDRRWIYLAALVAFMAAMGGNFQVWQRYIEPFVLILTALMAAEITCAGPPRWSIRIGALGLTLMLGSVTMMKLTTDKPVATIDAPYIEKEPRSAILFGARTSEAFPA